MANLLDLLRGKQPQPAPTPQPDYNRPDPWNDPAIAAQAMGNQPAPQATPPPVSAQPYQYAPPDPMAQAQQLADRQGAVGKLAGPVSPVLEAPQDAVNVWSYIQGLLAGRKAKK